MELVFDTLLVSQTGQWNSPFLLYAYTTLVWLGTYLGGSWLFLMIFSTLLTIFISAFFNIHRLVLPDKIYSQVQYVLQMLLCTGVFLLTQFGRMQGKQIYRQILVLLTFQRKLARTKNLTQINWLTEKVIKRILGTKQVFVCWLQHREGSNEWVRAYYTYTLVENGLIHNRKPLVHTFTDYMGKEGQAYYFPLIRKNEVAGAILIPLESRKLVWNGAFLILHLISISILNQERHIHMRQEMETAMQLEVRKKMAQDMHDGLAQQLFFVSAQIFQLKQNLPEDAPEQMKAAVLKMEGQVKDCHLEVRGYIHHLRDDREEGHIFDAIEQLLHRLTKNSKMQVNYSTKGYTSQERFEVEETIYRFTEEAVYNVLKHARATSLEVNLEVTAVQWTIRIKDDGVGFTPEIVESKKNSYGVVGMKERMERFGGILSIRSQPNQGTEIIAIIPREGGKKYA
ncbi:sensor histidine kinase [Brevibacillus ginsengisoli]|uniref:sensor histidine kinase n=1 Tax=Brevibacillus ginsengisoli TaxID=363854 RepID=UPI003CF0DEC6